MKIPSQLNNTYVKTVIKILISAAGLYWAFNAADINLLSMTLLLKSISLNLVVITVIVFNVSILFSNTRLFGLFKYYHVPMSWLDSLRWYYWGLFVNFFIPGSMGGDAYKGVYMVRNLKVKAKSVVQLLFVDRFIGMAGLFIWLFTLVLYKHDSIRLPYKMYWYPSVWALLILVIPVTYSILKLLFKKAVAGFLIALGLSIVIQGLQLLCWIILLSSFNISLDGMLVYGVVYFLSSILTMVPITIGGVGVRELAFSSPHLQKWVLINPHWGVGISVALFIITLSSAAIGSLFYLFGNNKKDLNDGSN